MGTIDAVDWSWDGDTVALAGSIGIHLYDASTFKIAHIIPTERPVGAIAFSHDGQRLMSVEWWNQGLHVWDTTSGQLLQSFDISTGPWTCAAFSPDGQTVALANRYDDTMIQLWGVTSGQLQAALSGHGDGVRELAFSPDGHLLASAGTYDELVRLWDLAQNKLLWTLPHNRWVTSLAFTPDGDGLVSGEGAMSDKTGHALRLWDSTTGNLVRTLVSNTVGIESLHVSHDGSVLAGVGSDNTVRLWDIATSALLRSHSGQVFVVGFSPDGQRLLSGSSDNTLQFWDTHTGQSLHELPTDYAPSVYRVAFSPDGQLLTSTEGDGSIRLRSTQTGQVLREIQSPDSGMAFTANRVLVSWGGVSWHDSIVHFWDTNTGTLIRTLDLPGAVEVGLAISPDGSRLALTAAMSNAVQLRDSSSGAILHVFTATVTSMTSVAFSPDGRWLAAGSWEPYEDMQQTDESVWLWDTTSGQFLRSFGAEGGYAATMDLVFSPDGSLLATASRAGQVQLWDPGTGRLLYTFEGGGYTAVFSPDGCLLASGDLFYDGINAHVWDPRTGKLLQVLKGHTQGPVDVAFSPDGRMLATGASDGTIRLWGVPAP
ncbi:MAG: WD40 repeat domain-containing protein [Thermoflexales bacterium]|nr:WD40 repeat domain-containing protein [Thermoflexales bacterium]